MHAIQAYHNWWGANKVTTNTEISQLREEHRQQHSSPQLSTFALLSPIFKDIMQLGEKSLVIWREVNNQMVKLARPIFYPLSNKLQRLEFVKGV